MIEVSEQTDHEIDLKLRGFMEYRTVDQALDRLKAAAVAVAGVLDAGDRDPTWNESQELDHDAIEYGRTVLDNTSGTAGRSEAAHPGPTRTLPTFSDEA